MAVSSEETFVEYTGNGSTVTPYPVPFRVLEEGHLKVRIKGPDDTLWTYLAPGEFTVVLVEETGLAYVTTAAAYAGTMQVGIERQVPIDQERVYPTAGPFPSKSHEGGLDKLTMICQQLKAVQDRSLRFAVGQNEAGAMVLPPAGPGFLGWLPVPGDYSPKIFTEQELFVLMSGVFAGTGGFLTKALADTLYSPSAPTRKVFYASDHCVLDSHVYNGGGTDDTVALQAILNEAANGPITLYLDGAALVSDTLVVRNDTEIICGPGCGVFKAANTWGHILTNRLSGVAIQDENIIIRGGVWNGNELNVGRYESPQGPGSWWKMGFWFAGVRNLTLVDVEIRDARTWALYLGGLIDRVYIRNIRTWWTRREGNDAHGNENWDGIHVNGDHGTIIIDGWQSNGDDDQIAMNTNENQELAFNPIYSTTDAQRARHTTPGTGATNLGTIQRYELRNAHFPSVAAPVSLLGYHYNNKGGVREFVLRNVSGQVNEIPWHFDNVFRPDLVDVDGWNFVGEDSRNGISVRAAKKVLLNRIAPGTPVRVYADEVGGDYFATRGMLAAVDEDQRGDMPVVNGEEVLQLDTGELHRVLAPGRWAAGAAGPTRAPVHFWRFTELSGARGDSAGSADLTPVGSVHHTDGKFVHGALLNGSARLDTTAVKLHGESEWTLGGWFQWNGVTPPDKYGTFFETWQGADGINLHYSVIPLQYIAGTDVKYIRPQVYFMGTTYDPAAALINQFWQASPGHWIFVALRMDNGQLTMWVDDLKKTWPVAVPTDAGTTVNSSIGGTARSASGYAHGIFSEWAIYDEALTDEEVAMLFNAGRPRAGLGAGITARMDSGELTLDSTAWDMSGKY